MTDFKETSVTRIIKPLMRYSKKVRKVTKYFDTDEEKIHYGIYLKRGNVSSYGLDEIDFTNIDTEEKDPNKIAAIIDDWLDEIVMSDAVLKETIELGYKIEWLD